MNNITIELCAEDRARIDRLTAALEARIAQAQVCIEKAYDKPNEPDDIAEMARAALNPAKKADPEEAPKNATEEAKASDHPVADPFPEPPATQAEPPKATAPSVTLDDLHQLIRQLAAKNKTALAREVVYSYGVKSVSKIPEEFYTEVHEKLRALLEG